VAFARPVQGQNLEVPTDPKHGLDLKTMATDFAKAYARGKTEGKELGTEGPPLSLGDVIIGFQDSHWPSALVLPQGPPSPHPPGFRLVSYGRAPPPNGPVLSNSHDLFKWRGKNRPQEFVSDMAERFVLVPTVQLLGAAVPERYHLIHAAYEDRVAREVEELIPPTMRGLAGLALTFCGSSIRPSFRI
jgi:hypothetical protein